MKTTLMISQKNYRKAFEYWLEAMMRENSLEPYKPRPGQSVEHPHGSNYAAFLPKIQKEFSEYTFTSGNEAEIDAYCDEMHFWIDQCIQQAKNNGEKDYIQALGQIGLDIIKSSLLDRLIYGKEKFRTRPCPQHKGQWSGLGWNWDGGCERGCDLTGWLPEGMSHEYDIPKILEERRQEDIKKAKKFIADNTTSPFKQTPDPEAAWRGWKRKEAKRLRINPAILGIKRLSRPTALELENSEWWKQFDLDILYEYLEKTGWEKLQIVDQIQTSWWKYTGEIATSQESRTYFFLPDELVEKKIPENLGIIQILTNKPEMKADFPRIIREGLQDIADITGKHLIDIICDAQNLGVRPTDLCTNEFLVTITPKMFSSYLKKKNWKKLGDDGGGNDVWQHQELPLIRYDRNMSTPTTSYLSANMINRELNHDRNRAIKVVNTTDYDDYGSTVWTLLNDLHRHEDRQIESIANDVMNTLKENINRQTSFL